MYDLDGVAPLWLGATSVAVFPFDLSAVLLGGIGAVALGVFVVRYAGRVPGASR